MPTFETTVQKGSDFLQRMTKQDQAVAAAVTLTAVATAIYATRASTSNKVHLVVPFYWQYNMDAAD